jgi:transcription-repair coupling factor (superfamily II helicase)
MLQGKIPSTLTDVKIESPADARIPEEYINETNLRIEIYQRLGEAVENGEVDDIFQELIDRYGKFPAPVQWLYHLTKIRIAASKKGCTLLKWDKHTLTIERQSGKDAFSKKVLFSFPKDPAEFERKTLEILSSTNFMDKKS